MSRATFLRGRRQMRIRRDYNVLGAPYIEVKATVTQNGLTNGKPNIKEPKYVIAPSAKKISTFIVNKIFGSDLLTQTEGLNVGWLMPTLREVLELCVYEKEAFVYLNVYDDKVYLECFRKCDIFNIKQEYDVFKEGTIIQEFDSPIEKDDKIYCLYRKIKIEGNVSTIEFKATEKRNEEVQISLERFNQLFETDYEPIEVKPYKVLINVDIGQDFFKDSSKLLKAEMEVFNVIVEEVEKTKTRIVTTQHYQTGDILANWKPAATTYNVQTLSVNHLKDYFTLLPGDKNHAIFEFLQGNVRVEQYISTFKFYDYQVIQLAGLSPSNFGYEKDAYQNVDNINLSKNASEMTIEAIKTQIESQINSLIESIITAQQNLDIHENELPVDIQWDYGNDEKIGDLEKVKILGKLNAVSSIPRETKLKVILPILNKLITDDVDKTELNNMLNQIKEENDHIDLAFEED